MIFLKYTQDYKGRKARFGASFYLVVAVCLLIIGGASWFALSNINDAVTPEIPENNEYSDKTSSYIENEESKTESIFESTPEETENSVIEETGDTVSEEPYSSKEIETEKKENVKAFTMPVEGKIIKEYSDSQLQYSKTYGDMRLHSGIDIACKEGTSVSACSDGTVLSVGNDSFLGNVVVVDHGEGLTVKYAALENLKVEQGTKLKCGDIIGTVTTIPSECGDESHIHIEVSKNGEIVSPLEVLK